MKTKKTKLPKGVVLHPGATGEPKDMRVHLPKKMTTQKAIDLIEGFVEPDYSEEFVDAWQYLVDTGEVWELHSKYGRNAQILIEEGLIEATTQGFKFL